MFRSIMVGMLVTVERRGLIEAIPKAARVLWKKWQLRSLVVFSLLLQILLLCLGNKRKSNGKPWLRFLIWSAYLSADLVATTALGVISSNIHANSVKEPSSGDDLVSFWAPFLLLHLGGPDTITAYSLEDNQLWQRRLLELVMQTFVAVYIFLMILPDASLSYLYVAMLVVGLIKFGERISSLRSASTEQFRQSLMTEPDPGPNYPKFMEEFTLKEAEGFYVRADEIVKAPIPISVSISGLGPRSDRQADRVVEIQIPISAPTSATTRGFDVRAGEVNEPHPAISAPVSAPTSATTRGFDVRAGEVNEPHRAISAPVSAPTSATTRGFDVRAGEVNEPHPAISAPVSAPTSATTRGFDVRAVEVNEPHPAISAPMSAKELVLKAHDLFQTFRCLFVDLILSFRDREKSQSVFRNLNSGTAFSVIEIELGFAFDVFYNKAPVVYNSVGYIFRLISISVTLGSFAVFVFISQRVHYNKIDHAITYLLFGGAIFLEFCALVILHFSDWSVTHKKSKVDLFRQPLWSRRRWSNQISQLSMLEFCRRKKQSYFPRTQKFFMADRLLDKFLCMRYNEVSPLLKELVFQQFMQVSKSGNKSLTALCTSRGTRVLERFACSHLMKWSTTDVDFDQSILLWHIATELCYWADSDDSENARHDSKLMSDYLLYLLVMCPFMLPIGIGMMRFRDTCAEADEFFKEKRGERNNAQVCKMLLRVNTEVLPGKVKGDRSKSVLFDACRLATSLRGQTDKWKIISQVWVEILAYAACHCRGTQHAQQLRKGGEFLTHVWLLMAHLGITNQFQISQGHARAKLRAK